MKCRWNLWNKFFFPGITHLPESEKIIYLTFDDGPTPGITSQVLAFLSEYQAKATFFCKGENVLKFPELFHEVLQQGHAPGNHGFSHLHGWYTSTKKYIADIYKANDLIPGNLFRPPYGKMKPAQFHQLRRHFIVYHWTALSWDFHPWISPEKCLEISCRHLSPGSILVFHDTEKASLSLGYALPRLLEEGKKQGFRFCALPVQ